MRILIKQGRVIDPVSRIDKICDVLVEDGLIVKIDDVLSETGDTVIDASKHIVLPGLVDIGVSLREPGYEYKATIASELYAAATAGVTTLCCSPDTDPPVSDSATASLIQEYAVQSGQCNVAVTGAMTHNLEGAALSEMAALKKAGCVAVSNALHPFKDAHILKQAMEYADGFGLPIMLHPIDHTLANGGCMHEGAVSALLGLPEIPVSAETAALGQYLALAEDTGIAVHFCRLSCAKSVEKLADAKKSGLPVTADVAVHQLFLTEESVIGFSPAYHVLPPFRSKEDKQALIEGVRDGIIDVVCSDHQPHDINSKLSPFPSAEPGISSIEVLLPLLLELAESNQISMDRAISSVACSAASVLNLACGSLKEGSSADICIVDLEREWVLAEDTMVSKGKNTPFIGRSFKGKISHTLLNGKMAYECG